MAAFSCAVSPDNFPFPDASSATGLLSSVLASKTLKIGALGASDGGAPNWGYQGDYQNTTHAVGFWPEYTEAILAQVTRGIFAQFAASCHSHCHV